MHAVRGCCDPWAWPAGNRLTVSPAPSRSRVPGLVSLASAGACPRQMWASATRSVRAPTSRLLGHTPSRLGIVALGWSSASRVFGPSSDHRSGSAAVQRRPDRQGTGDEFRGGGCRSGGRGQGADTLQGVPAAISQAISLKAGDGNERPQCLHSGLGCAGSRPAVSGRLPPLCRPGATAPVLTGKAPPVRTAPGRCGHPSRLRDGNPALPHHCRPQGCSPRLTRPGRSAPRRKCRASGSAIPRLL